MGVTQAKVDELAQSGTAAQQRLLGAGDDMGKPLGLDPKWSAQVIRAVTAKVSSATSARAAH
jgi:general L-amino acid transport system substrate-binding protein